MDDRELIVDCDVGWWSPSRSTIQLLSKTNTNHSTSTNTKPLTFHSFVVVMVWWWVGVGCASERRGRKWVGVGMSVDAITNNQTTKHNQTTNKHNTTPITITHHFFVASCCGCDDMVHFVMYLTKSIINITSTNISTTQYWLNMNCVFHCGTTKNSDNLIQCELIWFIWYTKS